MIYNLHACIPITFVYMYLKQKLLSFTVTVDTYCKVLKIKYKTRCVYQEFFRAIFYSSFKTVKYYNVSLYINTLNCVKKINFRKTRKLTSHLYKSFDIENYSISLNSFTEFRTQISKPVSHTVSLYCKNSDIFENYLLS